jgi:hypothetical protein
MTHASLRVLRDKVCDAWSYRLLLAVVVATSAAGCVRDGLPEGVTQQRVPNRPSGGQALVVTRMGHQEEPWNVALRGGDGGAVKSFGETVEHRNWQGLRQFATWEQCLAGDPADVILEYVCSPKTSDQKRLDLRISSRVPWSISCDEGVPPIQIVDKASRRRFRPPAVFPPGTWRLMVVSDAS